MYEIILPSENICIHTRNIRTLPIGLYAVYSYQYIWFSTAVVGIVADTFPQMTYCIALRQYIYNSCILYSPS